MKGKTVNFTAEIWLHRHYKTLDPLEYDIFNVSGYCVPLDLIEYMKETNGEFEWLTSAGVPTETPVRVKIEAYHDSDFDLDTGSHAAWWELTCTSWVSSWSAERREQIAFREANGLSEEDMTFDGAGLGPPF